MELKIRIKDVKEETRPITLDEKCMFLISTDMHYSQKIRDEIRKKLDALGLLIRVDSDNIVFRTETIRDATPDEVIAWHILAVDKACWNHECEICHIGKVYGCLYCVCDSNEANNARELLKGKEVILEAVE